MFWDIDTILPGSDFRYEIQRHLATSDVALVVISPDWFGEGPDGIVRLAQEDDFVRIEVETAIALSASLVPVLILGAQMPSKDRLPVSLEPLLYCNAVQLGDGKAFNAGYEELISKIDQLAQTKPKSPSLISQRGRASADPSLAAIACLLDLSKRKANAKAVRSVDTLLDLRYIWEIDNSAYGDANITFEVYSSWWLAFRHGLYALYFDDRPVGAIGLWPVPVDWLSALRKGDACEADLTASQIAQAGASPAAHWYVSGVVLDPAWQHTNAITTLLRDTTLSWAVECDLAFPVQLSAMAISEAGERLLAKYGFALTTPSFKMKDRYSLYERQLHRRDLKLLAP